MTLDEAARLAGGYRWAELRLFEVLGQWVGSTPEPEVKVMFDRHSQHHAWRAAQWWDRLPVLAGVDREELTRPIHAGWEAAYSALPGLDGPIARLAGAYRFALPRLAAAYADYQAHADPAGDGSGLRTVALVGRDLEADWREGEWLLQSLVSTDQAVAVAAETVARMEGLALR